MSKPDPQFGVALSSEQVNPSLELSAMYGITPDNKYIPIAIDDDGKLSIGSVTITGPITVSDVIIKGVDPDNGDTSHDVAVVNLGGGDAYALRTSLYDGANALTINADGSIPVKLTSGSIEIGTVDQGTPASIANAWPTKLTDGTHTIVVNSDGSINADISSSGSIPVTIDHNLDSVAIYGFDGTSDQFVRTDSSGNLQVSLVGSSTVAVNNFPATQPVSGTVAISGSVAVTGTFFQATQPISGSVSISNFPVTQPVSGTVAATQSGTWTVSLSSGSIDIGKVDQGLPNTLANAWPVELSDGTNLLGTSTHPVRTDPTGVTTQPISGTVAVTQSTSPWVISGTVTANAGTGSFTVAQATGTNLHTVVDSGTITVANVTLAVTQSGTWTTGRTWTLTSGADSVASVQSGTWNITNISGTVSLPTGAATAAKQPALGTAGTASTDVITVQGIASMIALKVDGSAVTQPISGTVTANAGSGIFSENLTEVGGVAIALGQTTMSASLPVAFASNQSALPVTLASTTITGTVGVTQSTSPWVVSGTVTANAGTGSFTVAQATGTNLHTVVDSGSITVANATIAVTQSGTWTTGRTWTLASGTDSVAAVQSGTWNITNISGTISLPTGASTAAKQPALGTAGTASADVITVQGIASMTALKVDGSAVTQPVSGTVTANAGTGSFTVAQATGTNLHMVLDSGTLTSITNALPAGTNVIGHVITDTGSTTVVTGTVADNLIQIAGNAVAIAATGIMKVGVTDSSGNPITSTVDGSQRGLDSNIINIQDNLGTGTITALNGVVIANTNGSSIVNFQVTGTWTATLTIQGSVDGSTWNIINGDVDTTDTIESTITTNTFITIPCGGFQQVRLIATAFTSGTANIAWEASVGGAVSEIFNLNPASLIVSNVNILSSLKQYHSAATGSFTPPATPTDMAIITGSATKTIRVTKIELSTLQTTAGQNVFFIVARSAANTGGTAVAATAVSFDSNNSAATAVVQHYSANPTGLGAAIGNVKVTRLVTPQATTAGQDVYVFDFTNYGLSSGFVLHGTTQSLCLNFNGVALPAGFSVAVNFEWVEE